METAKRSRLELLVARRDRFRAYAQRKVGSRDAADEVVQQAFLRALSTIDAVRDEKLLVGWFYRVLGSTIVDRARRTGAARRAAKAWAAEANVGRSAEPSRNVCACVTGLVPTLKPEYADVLGAVDVGEATVRDYASARGITANNAAVRLHRARRALGEEVERTCGACAAAGCTDCTCGRPGV